MPEHHPNTRRRMQIAGSTTLLTGADSALGAAILRELRSRGAGKIYADARQDADTPDPTDPSTRMVHVDLSAPPNQLASQLSDVEWMVHCAFTEPIPRSVHHNPTLEAAVQLSEGLVPVLSGSGGGTVVIALCELHSDELTAYIPPKRTNAAAQALLLDRLRHQLALRQIQLVVFFAHLVVGSGDRAFEDQRVLAGSIARRLLDQLDADRCREAIQA